MEIIILIKYFVLGLVQGITEPIPISLIGHLIIFIELFGTEVHGLSFDNLVKFASLLAVLIIYRKDIVRLNINGVHFLVKRDDNLKSDFLFIVYLMIATIPVGVIGLLFEDVIGEV